GNRGNLNLLYKFMNKGLPYPLAAFENRRSFLGVENLCFIVNCLLHQPHISSGVYNVVDDEPLSTNDIVRLIAEGNGKRPLLLALPKSSLKEIPKNGAIFHLPLKSERLKKFSENFIVSKSNIKRAIRIESLPSTAR